MDFHDTPAEADFRRDLRAWLVEHAPTEALPRGGPERAKAWQHWHAALFDGGWMGLSWPVEHGGRGLAAIYEAILNDEVGRAGAPPVPHVGYLGRGLLRFGTAEQCDRWLPRLLSGEDTWCQGFSEPGAGSDLAALSTRGVVDGDELRITGHKIWTSDAAWADWCLLLVRTDPAKHAGITAVVVDMASPGIEVRPIVQSNGDTEFNEVFLDDVRVPLGHVVGRLGQGWELAMSTVAYERGPADIGFSSRYSRLLRELEAEAPPDPALRRALAAAFVGTEVLRLHVLRSLSRRDDGSEPGPEGSVDKLLASATEQHLHHTAMRLHAAGALTGTRPEVLEDYLYSRGSSIYGGSAQIQRTIIAERVLGLPKGRP